MRWANGIQAIVGESFAEIFFGNCVALGIPCVTATAEAMAALMERAERDPACVFTLDLAASTVHAGDLAVPVGMPDGARQQLVEGRWDTTAELLDGSTGIPPVAAKLPYFDGWS